MGCRIAVFGAVLALLLLAVPAAGASTTFTDPQGDATGGAPDVTQVVVSNDFDGNVTFALTTDRASFTADDLVFVLMNTDKDSTTGINGVDYVLVTSGSGVQLLRATGASFAPAPQMTLRTEDGGKTVTINRTDIGDTNGLIFGVVTGLRSNDAAEDDAPDTGSWSYDLDLKPVLDTLEARFSPAKPKHGKPFRLSGTTLRVEDGTIVKADAVTCVAKLNEKRLAGRCAWRIPASARGKRLVVTLTAHYKGAKATFTPWLFRVG
jgi:hypothetical protein